MRRDPDGGVCDVACWRRQWDGRHRAWLGRLRRAWWLRGLVAAAGELERVAWRVVAAAEVLVDELAGRLPWDVRLARCELAPVAFVSLRQTIRGVRLRRRAGR